MVGDLIQVGVAVLSGAGGLGGLLWGIRRRRTATTRGIADAAATKPFVELIGAVSARRVALAAIKPGLGAAEREQLTRLAAVLMRPELIKPEPISGAPEAGQAVVPDEGETVRGLRDWKERPAIASRGTDEGAREGRRNTGPELPRSSWKEGPSADGTDRSSSKSGSGRRSRRRK